METLSPRRDPIPTVYVKVSEKQEIAQKKILIPKRMPKLMENCKKIFNDKSFQSILDERGYIVESIHDVAPNMTLYLSDIDPAFCRHDPSRRPKSPESKQMSKRTKMGNENEEENAEKEKQEKIDKQKKALLTKKTSPGSPTSSPRSSPTPSPKLSPTPSNFDGVPSPTKKKVSVSPIHKIDMRKISRPPSSSSDEDDGPADTASISTKLTAFLLQHEDNSDDEETDEIRRHREEKRRKKLMFQSVVSLQDPKNQAFQQLIEEIIPPQDAPKLMEDGLDMIPEDRKKFIQSTSDLEGEQLYLWLKGAANQPFLKRYPMQPYHDPITAIVSNFLAKHRFIDQKRFMYRFKSAVIGPPRSGKSTLLGNAVDNYILDLAATGVWKSTFILVLDFKIIAPLLNDYESFYYKILGMVLDALSKQRPIIRAHLPAIKRQMKSAIENRSPLMGIHPFREIDTVARHINEAWRNPALFCAFLNHVCMLPITLAHSVGLKNVSLFIDNIEYADINLYPHEPFDSRDIQAIFIEHLKYAINQSNFIISAEKSEKLFQILSPFDEDGVDLTSGMDYIIPFEATNDLGSRLRYDFLVECTEEVTPIRMNVQMCGGVVPYIAAWDELHHSLFVLERTAKDSDEYDEMKFTCIADAQTLIDLLFICEDSKKITVINVIRDKRGTDFKLDYDDESEKGSVASENKSHGSKSVGDKSIGDKSIGDKSISDKSNGEK